MGESFRICLVTPGHLGSNPRLVKEADALVAAGYQVHVIAADSYPAARVRDASILQRARWSAEIVPLRPGRARYWFRRARQMICRKLFSLGMRTPAVAVRAHHALIPRLAGAATRARADLYIGHCLAALPVVIQAGAKNGALVGFDAEDFHSGEAEEHGRGQLENAITRTIESRFLGRCDYLTAASPLIAAEYKKNYEVDPLSVLNVFPLEEAVEPQPPAATPSFYWFSQTVGAGRGLEEFIVILQGMRQRVILDLRGHVSEAYERSLRARVAGTLIELRLLPPDVPNSMVRNSNGYTAGLGLEIAEPLNRDLCLTNKAFTYLLAGVPVILSRTRAQEKLAADLGDAALLIDLKTVDRSGQRLTAWLENSEAQTKARNTAFKLGREVYNWDQEKIKFLGVVRETLARRRAATR